MMKSRQTLTTVITLLATFILMTLLTIFTVRVVFRTSYNSVYEIGEDRTSAITADLENYLENAKSVLWVAADTVDHMLVNGATNGEIINYITRESTNTEAQFDESYTGIYGVINGEYVDGVGWTPPEGYDPTLRDWYTTAVSANSEVVIVSPYVDAQTGNVIISICKSLSDPDNVLSLDLTLSGVQEIVEQIDINGTGYGFILNNDGMIIAHPDRSLNGSYCYDQPGGAELYAKALEIRKGNFTTVIDGEKCTVFVDEVLDQWSLIIVTKNSEFFAAPSSLLVISIFINLCVFALLSAFYILGYRFQMRTNKRIEAMKAKEQKREYESKILMLEKTAADNANKAKSEFLADMSHEIRTPINAVLGMNEMILNRSTDKEILEYSSSIKHAGGTLLSIINNILDFSKIEEGKMTLVPADFHTEDLITALIDSISERAHSKGLELKVDVDRSIPSKLRGDDVRISQVLMNLLTNAVKYTEEGSVTLRVKDLGRREDLADLRFEVIDTGIGIKEEDFGKLTGSFERVEERRNRHIEGTGLGISIVTKLLALMDSKLDIKSTYGEGSEFAFDLTLPVAEASPIGEYDGKRKSSSDVTSKDRARLKAPKAKVLVTDDNAMNLKVASNLLSFFGIKALTCSSGLETIELCRSERFDIIFLDHMMPKMDGIETLKTLKERHLIKGTVVIALTANAVVGAREQYLNEGFDDYLSKPIDLDGLEKMLSCYLPDSAVAASSEEPALSDVPSADLSGELSREKAEALGLNVQESMGYLGGDIDFYLEILKDYATDAKEKTDNLERFLNDKDWKNYKILVHSIKSASKTVGADDISAQARKLEEAAAAEDASYILANHGKLVSDYRDLAGRIL